MEDKNIMDLEDVTLNTLIETGAEVRLIFINGYQETVRIRDYGAETLLVEDQKEQKKLVYIHAVSTINMGWFPGDWENQHPRRCGGEYGREVLQEARRQHRRRQWVRIPPGPPSAIGCRPKRLSPLYSLTAGKTAPP